MKKTLLFLSLCAAMLAPTKGVAQEEPYTLQVFDQAVYYGMYQATVDYEVPEGLIRLKNWSYGKKLTQEQLDSFGNTLTATVTLNPLCDNYDRIGNVNMVLVPAGQESYSYEDTNITRIEIGRFITPFMNKNNTSVQEVPYVYELNHLTNVFHDASITAEFDIWIELEVYGYQGGPGQGGAAVEIPGCAGRDDVYMGSLTFESTHSPNLIYGDDHHFLPLINKFELKNYTEEGTDELGETVKTITFTLEEDLPNAKFHLITSNHGSNSGGEEYIRRWHYIYIDGAEEPTFSYKPGGKSCEPYRVYNTQGNGIYGPSPRTLSQWLSFNNWCPGDVIPNRIIEVGNLAAGEHTFKIDVPDAVFQGAQGYFPMSLYLESVTTTLSADDFTADKFSIYPNPVSDVATIEAYGLGVKTVTVANTLGQNVYEGTSERIDMSKLQDGIYIVNVTFENNQTAVKKIVKK